MILHALDSGDKLLYELIRSHACIPVTPDGRKLSFVQDLINPTTQLAVLYSKGQHIFYKLPHVNIYRRMKLGVVPSLT
mgnify:CR=1 FL=1